MADRARYRQAVGRLRCLRGIDYLTALALVAAIGDFRRFPTAGEVMAFLGLMPSEHSSGTKRHQGGITKSGNHPIRRLLVEASWHYRYSQPTPEGALRRRREGQSEQVDRIELRRQAGLISQARKNERGGCGYGGGQRDACGTENPRWLLSGSLCADPCR